MLVTGKGGNLSTASSVSIGSDLSIYQNKKHNLNEHPYIHKRYRFSTKILQINMIMTVISVTPVT
jgi:hypothetical protein